jgi:hypothetical protein
MANQQALGLPSKPLDLQQLRDPEGIVEISRVVGQGAYGKVG